MHVSEILEYLMATIQLSPEFRSMSRTRLDIQTGIEASTCCILCESGTFINRPNGLKKCFPCSSCDPGHGLFPKQECSPTSDTFCEALNGFFCKLVTSSGCTQAEKHSVCKTGQRIKEPETNRRDTVCEDCQEGYFSSEGVTLTPIRLQVYQYICFYSANNESYSCNYGSMNPG
uniref:TNFR-Cys domain-containing protein n=1 Tax=Kryptolebias marmoratus TaxID=37003 RepID=A0A3Q3AZL5_KRYMA